MLQKKSHNEYDYLVVHIFLASVYDGW